MELNFKIEAENCIKCAKIFKEDPLVHVPAVYKEISSERVLTMDFEDGVMVTDKQALR